MVGADPPMVEETGADLDPPGAEADPSGRWDGRGWTADPAGGEGGRGRRLARRSTRDRKRLARIHQRKQVRREPDR